MNGSPGNLSEEETIEQHEIGYKARNRRTIKRLQKDAVAVKSVSELRFIARRFAAEAIHKQVHLMRKGETHQVQYAASTKILEYALGKPAQMIVSVDDATASPAVKAAVAELFGQEAAEPMKTIDHQGVSEQKTFAGDGPSPDEDPDRPLEEPDSG